jgi:hypothetical protein
VCAPSSGAGMINCGHPSPCRLLPRAGEGLTGTRLGGLLVI